MNKAKICKNCKFAVIINNHDKYEPNVICMKRTDLKKGKIYLIQGDDKCRNYFSPIGDEENGDNS